MVASVFVCHKVSAHHQFANGTYFITSALVLKFSAFLYIKQSNRSLIRAEMCQFTILRVIYQAFEAIFTKSLLFLTAKGSTPNLLVT